jgi:hypothetical protein
MNSTVIPGEPKAREGDPGAGSACDWRSWIPFPYAALRLRPGMTVIFDLRNA